jgi:hypothetical protein
VLSGRGLCDELVTRPEESYRLLCVSNVCDHETSKNEEAQAQIGLSSHRKKNFKYISVKANDMCEVYFLSSCMFLIYGVLHD